MPTTINPVNQGAGFTTVFYRFLLGSTNDVEHGLQKLKTRKPDGREQMKVHAGLALVLLVLAGTVAHGQEITHNGYWWVDRRKTSS